MGLRLMTTATQFQSYRKKKSVLNVIINKIIKQCLLCEPPKWNPKVSLIAIVLLLNKALKKIVFCVNRSKTSSRCAIKSSTMDAANLQQKFTYSVFLVMYGQNLTIKSKLFRIRQWPSKFNL